MMFGAFEKNDYVEIRFRHPSSLSENDRILNGARGTVEQVVQVTVGDTAFNLYNAVVRLDENIIKEFPESYTAYTFVIPCEDLLLITDCKTYKNPLVAWLSK